MARMIRLLLGTVLACVAVASPARAQAPDPWSDFRFLLGQWEGAGKGAPGAGGGTFSFELALDGNVLIRRSHSEYPATKDRPATIHDDLMLVYREGTAVRALYVDNEKHVIHYDVALGSSPRTITFTSPVEPDAPRFRFIYRVIDTDTVNNRFEIAPPGKPDAFTLYIEGDAKKVR
jgi:hypothetical protein